MSTVAKIFVVINLLLAVAFVGAMSALLAEGENYKNLYENALDRSAARETALEAEAVRAVNERNDQLRQYEVLFTRYENVVKQWESARAENKELRTQMEDLKGNFDQLSASYQDLDDLIKQKSEENDSLRDRVSRVEDERDTAREAQRQAEELYFVMMTDLESAEGRMRELGAELSAKEKALVNKNLEYLHAIENPGDVHSPVAPPPIDGKVVAVSSDVPLVMLSVGRDDQVQRGHVFTVYRGGEFVCKVRVQDVFQDSASARIVQEFQKLAPREGDNVSTRIY